MVWSGPVFPLLAGLLDTIPTIREKSASCSLFTALQAATDCWLVGLLFFKKRNLSLIKAKDPASRNFTGGIGCAEGSSPGGRAHARRRAYARRRPPHLTLGGGGGSLCSPPSSPSCVEKTGVLPSDIQRSLSTCTCSSSVLPKHHLRSGGRNPEGTHSGRTMSVSFSHLLRQTWQTARYTNALIT